MQLNSYAAVHWSTQQQSKANKHIVQYNSFYCEQYLETWEVIRLVQKCCEEENALKDEPVCDLSNQSLSHKKKL